MSRRMLTLPLHLARAISWLVEHRPNDPELNSTMEKFGPAGVTILRSAAKELASSPEKLAAFVKRMKSSAGLDAIRRRADFQELLQSHLTPP